MYARNNYVFATEYICRHVSKDNRLNKHIYSYPERMPVYTYIYGCMCVCILACIYVCIVSHVSTSDRMYKHPLFFWLFLTVLNVQVIVLAVEKTIIITDSYLHYTAHLVACSIMPIVAINSTRKIRY